MSTIDTVVKTLIPGDRYHGYRIVAKRIDAILVEIPFAQLLRERTIACEIYTSTDHIEATKLYENLCTHVGTRYQSVSFDTIIVSCERKLAECWVPNQSKEGG